MTRRIYTAGVYAERDMRLKLIASEVIADGVILLDFKRSDGGPMPPWEPGAHMEIDVPEIGIRHYSLCGDPQDRRSWRVAVRMSDVSAAKASLYLHQAAAVGDEFHVIGPKNNFRFALPARGETLHFVAGGIGITPLLSMIDAAEDAKAKWTLTYFGKTLETMPFRQRLARYGDRVDFIPSRSRPARAVESVLSSASPEGRVYTCGPEPLIADAEESSCVRGLTHRSELFAYSGGNGLRDDERAFRVECTSSNVTVDVSETETIIMALARSGVPTRTSCEMGVCGTCEASVVEGTPDHRDSLLSEEERTRGKTMMICVGRALGNRLAIDI